ncbi:aldose epimerase family protein [Microvirga sp. 2MCAF38]|uniref:aldose epimerase family protein n=1 Tax=Microvirga sp. 2MCAF38 TaxID=3232989 RepID=UPI003F9A09C9
MTVERFGSIGGQDILEVALRSVGGGAEARILTWGAVVRDLIVPTLHGPQRVVLGLNSIEDYVAHSPYFGAVVGRYANRIGHAHFKLDGKVYHLDANEGRNQLHGGSKGFGRRIWSLIDHTPSSATLSLVSEDGDMGYPGRLIATCTYVFVEPMTLRIVLEATSDEATPVNLTTHGYFNLDGSADISSHHLMIAADYVTPTHRDLIPTGEIKSVEGTPYDFKTLRPIGAAQLMQGRITYDTNYVLRRSGELSHAATLYALKSGVSMQLWTTEPGLQFYDGHMIHVPVPGLDGAHYGPHAGLCLEPQRFPDGPNKAHFPACILQPGTVSRQVSELRFAHA